MLPYSVDFFDKNGIFIINSNVDDTEIATDYISGGENELTILNRNVENIERGGFVSIYRENEKYFGYIISIEKDSINNATINIRWCDILSLLNVDWCIDTDVQHSGTALETFIAQQIRGILNQVLLLNVNTGITLNTQTTSSTTDWGFNLKSETEGMHHIITNFTDVFIERALKEYDVVTSVDYSFNSTQGQTGNIVFNITVGKITQSSKVIETDIITLISKTINIYNTDTQLNRISIYNQDNYSQFYTYYYGTDDNIHRVDQDGDLLQYYPIVYNQTSIQSEGSFVSSALAYAKSELRRPLYLDLISLEVINNDTLINPLELTIASQYIVIYEGVQYITVLTGKTIKNGTTVLTFGTNRLDLTKILRKEKRNGRG